MSNVTQRTKQANMASTIDDLLRQLDATAVKSAETLSEPGSIGGSTTHPVRSVDDRLQKATEGSRSSENSEDIKEDQPNAGVDSTTAGTPGGQESVQLDVGITSKPTGEDPAAETDKAKGGKEDPGSSHPARTDNDELDGSKYSSVYDFYADLCKQAQASGNDLLATLAVEADNVKKASKAQPSAPVAKVASNVQPEQVVDAAPELDKQAVDALVIEDLYTKVAAAEDRAVKVAEYLTSYFKTRKQAEEGMPPEAEVAPEGDPGADAGGGGGEEALLGQLSGGGGAGPEMGGGGGEAGPEAGGTSEQDLAMLSQILQETGLTPEDLIELIAGAQGGGEGGGDPMGGDPMGGGGMPPPGAMPPPGGAPVGPPADPMAGKVASTRPRKWVAKNAADRAKYAKVKSHLLELTSANKR